MRKFLIVLFVLISSILLANCLSSTGHIDWDVFNKKNEELIGLYGEPVRVECFFAGLAAGLVSAASGIGSAIANWNSAKNTQEKIFEREDTAVQRRAKDLEAAGMSKTLAAGSAATTNVVSPPQVDNIGGKVLDAISAAQGIQQYSNMREENANLRKSREVMTTDMALKFSEARKNFAQEKLFEANASKANSDILLNSMLSNMYSQNIEESKSRSKTYDASIRKMAMESQNLYWQSLLNAVDFDLARTVGFRSTTGGLPAGIMKMMGNASRSQGSNYNNVFNIADMMKSFQQ